MRRTTLAVVLATGALAVPAVALAAGSDDPAAQTTPVQQQDQQQPNRPDRGDCPDHDGGSAPSPESGSGSNDTLL